MDTIKSIYTPLLKENSMKHIDYKTFNSIQTVANPAVETRYSSLQARVASLVGGCHPCVQFHLVMCDACSCPVTISSPSSLLTSSSSPMISVLSWTGGGWSKLR